MFAKRKIIKVDYFAFPRVGSHYLFHCFTGLCDLIIDDSDVFSDPEVRSRNEELEEVFLYALHLRDPEVPFQPVFIDPSPNGIHGSVMDRGNPIICLIRNPIAATYSLYRLQTDRFGEKIEDLYSWITKKFEAFSLFYEKAVEISQKVGDRFLFLSYEDLVESPQELARICGFIGVTPKLKPEFVHRITHFSSFVKTGPRTFYRCGNNDSWKEDESFSSMIEKLPLPTVPGLNH